MFAYLKGAEQNLGSDTARLSDAVDLVTDGRIGARWDSLAVPGLHSRSCERKLEEGEPGSDGKRESPHDDCFFFVLFENEVEETVWC
jgi:hypothetical protein